MDDPTAAMESNTGNSNKVSSLGDTQGKAVSGSSTPADGLTDLVSGLFFVLV